MKIIEMTKFIMVHKTKKLPNTDLRRTSFLIIGNIARLKYKFNYFTIFATKSMKQTV